MEVCNKWEDVKFSFGDLISSVKSYRKFFKKMRQLSTQKKGDYFEYFSKLYFTLLPEYQKTVKEYMLYDEIPEKLKKKLNLPSKDMGIDGLLVWANGSMSAVQVKFRNNRKTIPYGKLATFPGLMNISNGLKSGILFTSCYDTCSILKYAQDEFKNNKYQIVNDSCFDKCSRTFWNNVRNYIGDRPIIQYVPKTPYLHQKKILKLVKNHYKNNKYGRLYLPCGTGKSLMGLWTAKVLDVKSIFISVPSLYLLSETFETWAKDYVVNSGEKIEFVLVGSDLDKNKRDVCEFELTTDSDTILEKLDNYSYGDTDVLIVISTYQSSNVLIDVTKAADFKFDLGIFDEAHRTTGCDDKMFTSLVGEKEITDYRLYMTATERVYRGNTDNISQTKVYSMDNTDDYGDVIYRYSTRMAINDGQLVDYQIIASYITNTEYAQLIKDHEIVNALSNLYDINMIFTCLMIIRSMKERNFQHLLIFSNTNKKAEEVMSVIDTLLEKDEDLRDRVYTRQISGEESMTLRRKTVLEFEKSKRGIISSARIFGEGVNITTCDAVCFADNKSSTVDIIQCVGRCLRLCKKKPNKYSRILVPFVMDDDNLDDFMENDNPEYSKIRSILRALATTDDMIQDRFDLKKYCSALMLNNTTTTDETELCGSNISIDEFKKAIAIKMLDKLGDPISEARSILNHENNLRYANNTPLLISYLECEDFFKKSNKDWNIPIVKNWFRFCVSNKLYNHLKNYYYYNKDEFIEACDEVGINSTEMYKKRFFKDKKLPPISYINSGFYIDLDPKFNISRLLDSSIDVDF